MKKFALLALSFALYAASSKAAILESRIMGVDLEEGDTEAIVMAEAEGRVLRADARDEVLISALQEAAELGQTIRFDYSQNGVINGVLAYNVVSMVATESNQKYDNVNFVPTVFSSKESAQAAFNSMDKRTKRNSQCFNRAHGWAYDLWLTRGVSSSKVFIFFTRQYIRKYRYHWWFHVAPYVLVNVNGTPVEHVLDRSFTSGPREMRTWTNIFMKNDAFCPEVVLYSHYRKNQGSQWCYLIKTNMYYRSPKDLELFETQGRQELDWSMSELRIARKQAFKKWRSYNP